MPSPIKVIRKEGFWHTIREGTLLVLSRVFEWVIDTFELGPNYDNKSQSE